MTTPVAAPHVVGSALTGSSTVGTINSTGADAIAIASDGAGGALLVNKTAAGVVTTAPAPAGVADPNTLTTTVSESDDLILVDSGNADTMFILRTVKDAGVITSSARFQMDGTTPYAAYVGPPTLPAGGAGGLAQESDPLTVLFDAGNNYTPFVRYVTFDAAGGLIAGSNAFDLDGTAYTGYVGPDVASPPTGYLRTRTGRATSVTGPTTWDPNAQDVASFSFEVISGSASFDGESFGINEGASYGNDLLDVPIVGSTVISVAGPGDTVRISYTELS